MLDPIKTGLSDFLHLSKDALHVHLGIAIFLFAALVLRRGPGNWMAWLVLLALECVNEGFDLAHDLRHGGVDLWSLGASLKDIFNTMVWPTALLLAFRSGLFRLRDRPPRGSDGPARG